MFERKHVRKVFAIAIACAMSITCAFAVAGCSGSGQSDEDQVKALVSSELDAIKNLDSATLDTLIGNQDDTSFKELGVDMTEFVKTLFDGFDYQVDGVTVDEDKATAQVTVTCKKLANLGSFEKKATELIEKEVKAGNTDTEKLMKKIGPLLLDEIKAIDTSQAQCELTFEKKDGEWAATDDNVNVLKDLLVGDISKVFS